jgi:hypothetical protein
MSPPENALVLCVDEKSQISRPWTGPPVPAHAADDAGFQSR